MANTNLANAKTAKNDEFYTQYNDIQKEINAYLEFDQDVFRGKTVLLPCDDPEWSNFTKFFAQNFEAYGLKKLISTSYAVESKKIKEWEPTLFETESPYYDADKSRTHGKILFLDEDINGDGRFNINDLQWSYLEGDGDFRSDEVKALRDEADIIITNPPFSLFREFMAWIMEVGKKFIVIGNKNAITYKEIFPLIKDNKIWYGPSITGGDREFMVPKNYETHSSSLRFDEQGNKYIRVPGVHWFTNLEIKKRQDDIILYKHYTPEEYPHYVNYDAIEVSKTADIPCDYEGTMGVPITFLDKYNPDQFEILGIGLELANMDVIRNRLGKLNGGPRLYLEQNGELVRLYERILIRKK